MTVYLMGQRASQLIWSEEPFSSCHLYLTRVQGSGTSRHVYSAPPKAIEAEYVVCLKMLLEQMMHAGLLALHRTPFKRRRHCAMRKCNTQHQLQSRRS